MATPAITRLADLYDIPDVLPDGSVLVRDGEAWRAMPGSDPGPVTPLAIPTPDNLPSVGHPDVVYVPEGWNGYRYWMAFTPYPPLARENPCVVASHDGINWEVPPGGTNPVVPLAEVQAQGFNGNSDTDMLLLADGVTMALYYRPIYGSGGEAIYRKTSTDGVTWSAGVEVVARTGIFAADFASPAVVLEADGTYTMFTTNVDVSPHFVERRTSAAGLVWSAPVTVALPTGIVDPWHIDVQRHRNRHYALIQENNRLYFLVSRDGGATWKVDPANLPVLPLTDFDEDESGNYRSCFLLAPGDPLTFKVWTTVVNSPDGNVFNEAAAWRIIYRVLRPGNGVARLWLPANVFSASVGAPTLSVRNSRWPAWAFSSSQSRAVSTSTFLPASWRRFKATILWTNAGAGGGAVRWTLSHVSALDGAAMSPGNDATEGFGSPIGTDGVVAPLQDILKQTVMVESKRLVAGPSQLTHFRVNRTVGGNDTLANDAALFGILLERVA